METKMRPGVSGRKTAATAAPSVRPLRALFMHLNQPEASLYGRERIAIHAEASMRVIGGTWGPPIIPQRNKPPGRTGRDADR